MTHHKMKNKYMGVWSQSHSPKNGDGVFLWLPNNVLLWFCPYELLFYLDISEFFLLVSMPYNCYVANCTPLLYHIIISPRLCLQLVVANYAVGLMNMVLLTSKTSHLTFCKFHVIIHYFCDIPPFLKLSYFHTQIPQLILFDCGGFNISVSMTIILVFYTCVFLAIIRIPSFQGKQNTIHLCSPSVRCQPVL